MYTVGVHYSRHIEYVYKNIDFNLLNVNLYINNIKGNKHTYQIPDSQVRENLNKEKVKIILS